MHIVHIAFEMETGGSQVLVVDLLNEMCRHHTLSLVIINDQYNTGLLGQIDKSVNIYYLHRRQHSYNPLPFFKLNRLLLRLRPHIIHCHEYNTGNFIRIKTGKLVYTVHAIGLPVKYYARYQLLVAISQAVRHDVQARCARPAQTIYNGIQVQAFKQRSSLTAGPGVWKLVQLGRLDHAVKGQDSMLQVLHELVHKRGFTRLSLDIVGSGGSLAYLQSMAADLGVEPWVRFAGEKERSWLYENLADYHVLVQPSRSEGFGLSLLEGMAAGLPVLTSNVFGPAEILPGLPAAFLFEPGDVAGCADQIMHIRSLYETGRLAALVKESINLIRQKYSLQACAAAYLEAYRRIIS